MSSEVLIVGGGLSGLSLARRLVRKGSPPSSIQLLEARDRAGGRILSAREAEGDPAAAYDLGPSWFWPGQRRMEALLKELDLSWFEQYAKGDLMVQVRHEGAML